MLIKGCSLRKVTITRSADNAGLTASGFCEILERGVQGLSQARSAFGARGGVLALAFDIFPYQGRRRYQEDTAFRKLG